MQIAYKSVIRDALDEDLKPDGDITSSCLINPESKSKFKLKVNEDVILAGFDVFCETFLILDKNILIKSEFHDGSEIKKGSIVADLSGNTLKILKGERTALNFLSHLSGIATETKKLVSLIKNTNVTLLDTRKTTPNLRQFEKQAILSGGAKNHRFNLSEMVLIKDNHILNTKGVSDALLKVKKKFSLNGKRYKIEIEVKNLKELKEAIILKPDVIMFDNWELDELKEAVKLVPNDILTEASGQITPENILNFAKCGVNYISTSYMIKNARWIDFSLDAI